MGMKDEDLAGLSDEERAALEDDDGEADIIKSIAGDDGNDADDDNSSGDGEDDDSADDDDAAAAAASADDAGANVDDTATAGAADVADPDKAAAAADKVPVVVEEFQPEFKAASPDNFAERMSSLDEREAKLDEEFSNGNIDNAELRKQLREIERERTDLTIEKKQAEWAEKQNTDSREQRWKWEQERFFGQDKAAIYKDEKDPIALAALNATVKQLASDPANNRRSPGWFLEEADRRVRERFNLGASKVADTPKKQDRTPDLSKVPKTLANLPAADIAETGADEFAYLDKLDGIALEQALRKLTPEQEARYLGVSA